MFSRAGSQKRLVDALTTLAALCCDALEACKVAVRRLDDVSDLDELRAFLVDHERHIVDLRFLVSRVGGAPPETSEARRWLARAKVVVVGHVGDGAVLLAIASREDEACVAYERVLARGDLPEGMRAILTKHRAEVRRHREWIEARVAARTQTYAGRSFAHAK